MAEYDFGQSRIKELERQIKVFKKNAEGLINVAFSDPNLRNHWRIVFGIEEHEVIRDNGDMT